MEEMLHIVGQVSTHKILEIVWMCSTEDERVFYQRYNEALEINYRTNCALFKMPATSDISIRIDRGDKWEAIWQGDKIIGIHFPDN